MIQWDEGDALAIDFTTLVGDPVSSLELGHTIYENISSGQEYRFKYYAVNTHGAGETSDILTL